MGARRKIEIERLTGKDKIAVTCSKRLMGLYNKTTDLYLLSDRKAALFATTPGNPCTFYSFGCPSADVVANAFLENRLPSGEIPESVYSDHYIMKDVKRKIQKAELERSRKRKMKWEMEDLKEYETTEDLPHVIDQLTELKNNVSTSLKKIKTSITAERDSDREQGFCSYQTENSDHGVDHTDDLSRLYSILDKDDDDIRVGKEPNEFMVEFQQLIDSPSSDLGSGHGVGHDVSTPAPLTTPDENIDHSGNDTEVDDSIFYSLEMITDLRDEYIINEVEAPSSPTSDHVIDPSSDLVCGFQMMEAPSMPDYHNNGIYDPFYNVGESSEWSTLYGRWN